MFSLIILAAIQDDATAATNVICHQALEKIGGKKPFQREFRGSFGMIGYKGTEQVNWIEQKMSSPRAGPTELKKTITLLQSEY